MRLAYSMKTMIFEPVQLLCEWPYVISTVAESMAKYYEYGQPNGQTIPINWVRSHEPCGCWVTVPTGCRCLCFTQWPHGFAGPNGYMTMMFHICRPRESWNTWFGVIRPDGHWVTASTRCRTLPTVPFVLWEATYRPHEQTTRMLHICEPWQSHWTWGGKNRSSDWGALVFARCGTYGWTNRLLDGQTKTIP